MDITAWLEKNLLQYTVEDKLYTIADKKFLLIEPKEMPDGFKIFDDEDFRIKLEQSDYELIDLHNPHYFLFSFGQQWYYTPVDKADTELNLFKYLGKAKLDIKCPEYIMLGCHTGFELCNGSQMPEDWIKKAQFLGMDRLGICELNTLAGALKFQDQCDKAKIKSIIGETITVKKDNELYELKLFVKNEIGWQNLLNINSQLNVFNETFVLEEFVFKHSQGLICVVSSLKKLNNKFIANIKKYFEDCFYQLDFVQYQSNEKDREHLLNLQGYLQTWLDDIQPVLLCDAYYLDQQDYYIKNLLNKVGKIGFKHQSKDQYFKTVDDITMQAGTLGIKPETLDIAMRNSFAISESCNFKIRKDQMHLPKYEMNEEQKKKFETNNDLFFHLIEKGFEERIVGKVEDDQIYYDRFAEEITIIEKGGFIDYFLILWDILNWCKENDILTGPGRGSSASALTSYLLYITHLDPIRYKLIFERFLNEARLKSLPDIDVDFESEYRDKVKQYIQTKYTFDNVCCIGTFNNFKIKSCIKDLSREMNIDYSKANFISSLIDKDFEDGTLIDLFKCSLKEPKLKEFINEYPNLIHAMQLILFQPKVKSIHAAGVIVTPKYTDKSKIYDLLPVRVEDGILISEWDKLDVDATGFLKEDILGLHQLDKINNMLKLIKKNRGITIDINTIDVTDQKVFEYFKKGLTEDVFQFNTDVQKKYMIDLQPETIEELIAANALNRPGPMESNAQIDFIKRKNGQQEVKYDKYLEDVTKDTLGLYCFQEQVMAAYKIITECTPAESDAFRKLTSKIWEGMQDDDKIIKAKKIFFDAYMKKGVTEDYAQDVWDKLIRFSGYGFNIAHSASYAVLGFYSLWFKVHYPLEFWTVSLQFSKEELISAKLTEIDDAKLVKVIAPDINNSNIGFTCDPDTNKIYWSISSVKFAGEVAVASILEERNKKGKFKSLKDFYQRKQKVNKRVIEYLIIAGCFDEVEKVKTEKDRWSVMVNYYKNILGEEVPEQYMSHEAYKDSFWQSKAKEFCGYGYINYDSIVSSLKLKDKYMAAHAILALESIPDKPIVVAGTIALFQEKSSPKAGKYARITLDDNNITLQLILWNDLYEQYADKLKQGSIIVITNVYVKEPNRFSSVNSIQGSGKSKIFFV